MIIGEFRRLRGGAPDGQQGTTTGQVGRVHTYISYSLLCQSIVQVNITEYHKNTLELAGVCFTHPMCLKFSRVPLDKY